MDAHLNVRRPNGGSSAHRPLKVLEAYAPGQPFPEGTQLSAMRCLIAPTVGIA